MRYKVCFLYLRLVIFSALCSCGRGENATNSVTSLSDFNPEIAILNWRIIGPFHDSISNDDLFGIKETPTIFAEKKSTISNAITTLKTISDTAHNEAIHYQPLLDTLVTQELGYFIDLEKIFSTAKAGFAYALCDIISKGDAEVAFLLGGDNNIKVWVNEKLYVRNTDRYPLEKNKIIEKIPLQDGLNRVLLEIANVEEELWSFNLSISTIEHVRENALITDNFIRKLKYKSIGFH